MNYKELEDLGYTTNEIQEIQQLGLAELVVSAHHELEHPKVSEKGAPTWATACLATLSAILLSAPWAGAILEGYQGIRKAYEQEAHRSLLEEAFEGNEDYLEYEWSPVPENPSYQPDFGCLVHKYAWKTAWSCKSGTEWEDQDVNEWIDELPDE